MLRVVSMKLERKSVTLVLALVVLLCAALGIQSMKVMADARTAGVQVGDWANYSASASGNWTEFVPADVPVSESVTVTDVTGTNVTLEMVSTFSNTSQTTDTGIVDVETGSGNASGSIIAANLNAGDLVYTGTWEYTDATINETITHNYLGSNVEVNHLNITTEIISLYVNSSTAMDYFWFKDTGVIAEMVINGTYVAEGTMYWMYMHLEITGMVPEFPISIILPLFLILSTLAVVTAKKKLYKTSAH
jgi:hypothetical protein